MQSSTKRSEGQKIIQQNTIMGYSQNDVGERWRLCFSYFPFPQPLFLHYSIRCTEASGLWRSRGFNVTVLAGFQPKWSWIDHQAERYPAFYKSSDIPVDWGLIKVTHFHLYERGSQGHMRLSISWPYAYRRWFKCSLGGGVIRRYKKWLGIKLDTWCHFFFKEWSNPAQ